MKLVTLCFDLCQSRLVSVLFCIVPFGDFAFSLLFYSIDWSVVCSYGNKGTGDGDFIKRSRYRSRIKQRALSCNLFYIQTAYSILKWNNMAYFMTLTLRSRLQVKVKCSQNQTTSNLSDAIWPTDFILGMNAWHNKRISMTHWSQVNHFKDG